MSEVRPIRRAILAPYDKTGLVPFASALVEHGVELVASGGTAKVLADAGLPVTPVEEVTGSPEMLGGRVKTLHPKIHGGLLADRRDPDHVRQLQESEIAPFDLLVGGLYPFRETVASGADPDTVVENIDIGGPAMMRAAAKNFESVTVIVDPAEYAIVLAEIEANDGVTRATRRRLAAAAFAHTAAYDAAVAGGSPSRRPARTPCPGSSDWRTRRSAICATARTHTNEAGSTARPRPRAARRCERAAGQGHVVQQLARRVRRIRPRRRAAHRVSGDRQTQQSVWCRSARLARGVVPRRVRM